MTAKTKTWSDILKVLKTEDELETANSDESGIESEVFDSIEMFDSEYYKSAKGQAKKRVAKVAPIRKSGWNLKLSLRGSVELTSSTLGVRYGA